VRSLPVIMLLLAAFAFAQELSKEKWQAPVDASAKKNPLHGKPELAVGGKKIFERTCKVCHDSASANQKGPHLDLPEVQADSDGALFWKISNGNSRSGMPNFSSLPDGQRWQLVLYIRSLAHKQ
jgi:mono/diheme cytochrome c family protein